MTHTARVGSSALIGLVLAGLAGCVVSTVDDEGETADELKKADAAAAAPAVTKTFNIWHWNVAGNAMNRGSTTNGMLYAAVSSMQNRKADFVALNELCYGQYEAIKHALRAAGWPQDPGNFSRFEDSLVAGTPYRCEGKAYGNAIFSKLPLGSANRYTLPDDGQEERRSMLCAPVTSLPHLRFCTTHISTKNDPAEDGVPKNERQLNEVLKRLEAFHAKGDTVLIAGDFNAHPNYKRMNGFYSSTLNHPNNAGNTGAYRELDDNDKGHCLGYGEGTVPPREGLNPGPCGTGAKIDMIFARESAIVGPYSGDALNISEACGGPCSDHKIVIGTVTVRIRE